MALTRVTYAPDNWTKRNTVHATQLKAYLPAKEKEEIAKMFYKVGFLRHVAGTHKISVQTNRMQYKPT